MRTSVHDAFLTFTTTFEGRVNWMSVDIKGFVTVGIGNLIDPDNDQGWWPVNDGDTTEPSQ